ncbi:glycosyltransferase, partial [Vibrio parahaemolyticus]
PLKPNKEFVTLLFMGWLEEEKGVYDIAEAIKHPFSKPVHLVFMGDGGARGILENIAASLHENCKVSFTGWVYGKEKMQYLSE